jgi:tetratricopeptide (TPR) repeat protein
MRRAGVVVAIGLVALTLAAYGPIWANDFINLDDEGGILKNPGVRAGITARGLRWAWTSFLEGHWTPLTWMSLQLDASLSPRSGPTSDHTPSPVLCHAQNLFWHTTTVVLLFYTLWCMTGAMWCSAFAAALFAVHPLHVESVAWATERRDVLSTFFLVLTVLAYAHYAEQPSARRYLVVLAAYVVGLLAKSMLVTLPFALLLLDWWPLRRLAWTSNGRGSAASGKRTVPARRAGMSTVTDRPPSAPAAGGSPPARGPVWLLLEKVPLLAAAAGASAVAVVAQRSSGALVPTGLLTVPARLANAVTSGGWYLEKSFWPTRLAIFYPHTYGRWQLGSVLGWAAVLLTVTGVAVAAWRRWPWLGVGWLWFLGTLVPVLGLVQAGGQGRADRYAYVPHIGLLLALSWGVAALLARWPLPAAAKGLFAAACLIPLAALTWVQVGYWRDSRTVWEHALAVTIDNERARFELASYLYNQGNACGRQGIAEADPALLTRAQQHYAEAIALWPNDFFFRYNFGMLLLARGDADGAAQQLKAAVRLKQNADDALHNLGVAHLLACRPADAERSLRRALEVNPAAADTRAQLGTALWRQGRHDDAVAQWQASLRAAPQEPEALTGTGVWLLRQRQPDAAVQQLTAAAQLSPSAARWSLVGRALGRLGRWPEAVRAHALSVQMEQTRQRMLARPAPAELALYQRRLAHALQAAGDAIAATREYAEADKLDPGWPQSAATQAWRLATHADPAVRDPDEAQELAAQACQAQADPPAEALDGLAAAQAAAGQYGEAAATARRALAKAPPALARLIRQRARLYQNGRAFVADKAQAPGVQPQR